MVSKLVLIRPYLMMTMPLDSDFHFRFVVAPCVADVFVELETSNSKRRSDSDIVVAVWTIVYLLYLLH